jgi:hypothetical protein
MIFTPYPENNVMKGFSVGVLLFSTYTVISLLVNLWQTSKNLGNPLIPEQLIDYVAFPLYFLVPLFSVMAAYSAYCLLKKGFHKPINYIMIAISALYFLFGAYIYNFINSFNPYG